MEMASISAAVFNSSICSGICCVLIWRSIILLNPILRCVVPLLIGGSETKD